VNRRFRKLAITSPYRWLAHLRGIVVFARTRVLYSYSDSDAPRRWLCRWLPHGKVVGGWKNGFARSSAVPLSPGAKLSVVTVRTHRLRDELKGLLGLGVADAPAPTGVRPA
jgi:hypothetical protein